MLRSGFECLIGPKTCAEHRAGRAQKRTPSESTDLVFNSSTLPDVMEKLSKYYNMKIAYDKDEIKAMNFTGTITKKDSLQIILKVIGQMNDLEISSNDSGFVVQKILQQQDEK